MEMKQKWIDAYMDTAHRFAELSSARRLKVGAIVVKDNKIISIGYNGTPSGWNNDCEELVPESIDAEGRFITSSKLITKRETIHAETNAICKLARSNERSDGSVLFCTHSPCIECAKLIYASGISTVYYKTVYRDTDGINFLEKCNVTCHWV